MQTERCLYHNNVVYSLIDYYLFEVEIVSILIEEFFITYLFCDHAAAAFRAENIESLSRKKYKPAHIANIFIRQSHLFSSSSQYNQGLP